MAKTKPTLSDVDVELDSLQDSLTDDLIGNVYMFFNKKRNLQVYVDADGWNDAYNKFDTCEFQHPEDWEIYLKIKQRSN